MEKNILMALLVFVLAYIIGGIPTGYLVAKKVKGIDIRKHGSGNPGATNVFRVVGKKAGIITFIIDALKGFVSVMLAKWLCYDPHNMVAMSAGIFSICGHMWTVFLKFKGGKGVATSAGAFAALLPVPTALALVVFIIFVWSTGLVAAGSIAAAATLPVFAFFIGPHPWRVDAAAALVGSIVIYKHIPNIKRILKGTELSFKKKKHEHK